MKTFLIVYTENNSIGSDQVYNIEITAPGKAEAYLQVKEKIGDKIIILNIIEL